jgi:hypothetical protein
VRERSDPHRILGRSGFAGRRSEFGWSVAKRRPPDSEAKLCFAED